MRSSPVDGEETPLARDALELVRAEIGEFDTGAGYQWWYRGGHEYLPGSCRGEHARGDVHRDPRDVAVGAQLHLARVQPNRELHAQAGGTFAQRSRAGDR